MVTNQWNKQLIWYGLSNYISDKSNAILNDLTATRTPFKVVDKVTSVVHIINILANTKHTIINAIFKRNLLFIIYLMRTGNLLANILNQMTR